ncbi:PHP domain-containing protein [Actinoplanes sp. NBRC 103695]|uniref:PHP domain-containing protein n=1 Tax=Actinoplanes sp. NBRC 103695 TaxID=3032202 RepID=UPI0025555D90|nr:PHP domain-containing protein [Actinoplanes sp. NBRC 103695]
MPPDNHVHTEWSWDTAVGSMEGSCARAVELGLPSIAFTEHVDHTSWYLARSGPYANENHLAMADENLLLTPPPLDVDGYLDSVDRCRTLFPGLRILTGVELGQPHWHAAECAAMLGPGSFERVLGSQHCLPHESGFAEPWLLYPLREPASVMRDYLAEVVRLVNSDAAFEVLAHIDYAVRSWPLETFDPEDFEEEFRYALRATARSGRALEVSTRIPMHATILRWWREEGGGAISFGSDAHQPELVAHGFREAADLADANGFRRGRSPADLWIR